MNCVLCPIRAVLDLVLVLVAVATGVQKESLSGELHTKFKKLKDQGYGPLCHSGQKSTVHLQFSC